MKISKFNKTNKQFVRANDTLNKDIVGKIVSVEDSTFVGGGVTKQQPVLHLDGPWKFGLNKSNRNKLAAELGDETDDWQGVTVRLSHIKSEYNGEPVGSVEVTVIR